MHHNALPSFIRLRDLATYLGVSYSTARAWVLRGQLRACRLPSAHYSDQRPRTGQGGHWRIYRDDLRAFLATFRAGQIRMPRMRRSRVQGNPP